MPIYALPAIRAEVPTSTLPFTESTLPCTKLSLIRSIERTHPVRAYIITH